MATRGHGRLGKLTCQCRDFRTAGSVRYHAAWAAHRHAPMLPMLRTAGVAGQTVCPLPWRLHTPSCVPPRRDVWRERSRGPSRAGGLNRAARVALHGAPVVALHRAGPPEPRRGRSGVGVANLEGGAAAASRRRRRCGYQRRRRYPGGGDGARRPEARSGGWRSPRRARAGGRPPGEAGSGAVPRG